MKICIDPGHGGEDSGAVGPTGLEESAMALDVSHSLATRLGELDIDTNLTRASDTFVELDDRCKLANRWEADFFVSVHLNSNGPDASGIETLYASAAGRELAMPVQIALVAATGEKDRGVKERNDLYVLNGTDMPAILVEVGFISHPATEAKVKSQSYRDTLAAAIAEGIADYLGLDDEEPASV